MVVITRALSHTTFATEDRKIKVWALVITHLESPLSLRFLQIFFPGRIWGEAYINHSPITCCFPNAINGLMSTATFMPREISMFD